MKTLFSPLLLNTKPLFGGFLPLVPRDIFPELHMVLLSIHTAEQLVCIYSFIWGNGVENSVSVLI